MDKTHFHQARLGLGTTFSKTINPRWIIEFIVVATIIGLSVYVCWPAVIPDVSRDSRMTNEFLERHLNANAGEAAH